MKGLISTLSKSRAVVRGGGHSTPFWAHRSSKNLRVSGNSQASETFRHKSIPSDNNDICKVCSYEIWKTLVWLTIYRLHLAQGSGFVFLQKGICISGFVLTEQYHEYSTLHILKVIREITHHRCRRCLGQETSHPSLSPGHAPCSLF